MIKDGGARHVHVGVFIYNADAGFVFAAVEQVWTFCHDQRRILLQNMKHVDLN